MVGLGEPREVQAGVVGGSYFDVMGLHPVLGRLLDMRDDGPKAAGAMVLTYRFWRSGLKSDPSVHRQNRPAGRAIRHYRGRAGTIHTVSRRNGNHRQCRHQPASSLGHHGHRTRPRMTELFGRLAPGVDSRSRPAPSCASSTAAMIQQHPEAYSPKSEVRIDAVRLRDQITSRARTVLLVLMAASVLVFVIACSNIANLILARTIRREGELSIRAALGASTGALAPDAAG